MHMDSELWQNWRWNRRREGVARWGRHLLSTFAKSMAKYRAFGSLATIDLILYLRYNMRSQIFAKSLPMLLGRGCFDRLKFAKNATELRNNLWKIVNATSKRTALKNGFSTRKNQNSPVKLQLYWMENHRRSSCNWRRDLRENYAYFPAL